MVRVPAVMVKASGNVPWAYRLSAYDRQNVKQFASLTYLIARYSQARLVKQFASLTYLIAVYYVTGNNMSFNNLNKPFYVGNVLIPGILSLGPMAGVTDVSFRTLCKEMGCDLLYTEMVSAKGIYYNNKNTEELLKTNSLENPIALQLFGNDGKLMGEMAGKLSERPFDIIDINMGCPVPKVVGNKEGSYIMNDPDMAFDIVSGIVARTDKPVSVKIRKGFETESAPEIAKACEAAGAKLVAVHGRLRTEYYQGVSDWCCIKRVKDAVSIPVIGSGDIKCEEDMVRMISETGCDGVMIARAARGNPFIFKRFKHYLETGEKLERPDALSLIHI